MLGRALSFDTLRTKWEDDDEKGETPTTSGLLLCRLFGRTATVASNESHGL